MEAKERELGFIKGQKIYKVPFFQRGYVWDEENWSDLWDELVSKKKDCFLGSVIIKSEKTSSSDDITYKTVIDGQQRLTTLTIILRALNDSDSNEDEVDSEIEEFLFYVKKIKTAEGKKKKRELKIQHSHIDRRAYTAVIEGEYREKLDEIKCENQESVKILRCYKFFREKLSSATEDEIKRIEAKLTYDTSKILVVIDLDEDENEQAIFDTINSAGVKLTNADIIKNALFQNIIYNNEGGIDEDILQFYQQTWVTYFEKDQELLSAWLAKKVVGRIERTNIDMFLHCYAVIRGIYDPQENKMEELSDCYKKYLKDKDRAEIKEFVKDLCDHSEVYREYFIGFDQLTAFTYDNQKMRLLHILSCMKVTTFDAYILNALMHYPEDKLNQEFHMLECYVMRNYITSNTNRTKNYNKDSVLLLQGKFDFAERFAEEDQDDIHVEKALKNIRRNSKAALVLFWIELYRHRMKESDLHNVSLNYHFQLEHVMPQMWNEFWGVSVLPVTDKDGNVVDDEHARVIRGQAVYEIGNMTLLTSTLNNRLRNYPFEDKVNGKIIAGKFKDGMKKYSSLSISTEITSRVPLVWNEAAIIERTERLTKEFLEIWPNKC